MRNSQAILIGTLSAASMLWPVISGVPWASAQQPVGTAAPVPPAFVQDGDYKISTTPALKGRIAFTAVKDGIDRLLVLDLDLKKIRKLVDGAQPNHSGVWSPDGSKIVFVSERDADKEIYISDWNGNNQQRLTNHPGVDESPDWSPDGKRVIFSSQVSSGGTNPELALATIELNDPARTPRVIAPLAGRNTTPRYSPDGETVAYATNRFWPGTDICILTISSKKEKCPLGGKTSFSRPTWAESGTLLAYSLGQTDQIGVGIFNLKDSSTRQFNDEEGRSVEAVFSPGDDYLLYARERDRKEIFHLALLDLGSGNTEELPLLEAPFSIRSPSWSAATTFELETRRIRETQSRTAPAGGARP